MLHYHNILSRFPFCAVLIYLCQSHRAPKPIGTASPLLASLFHLTLRSPSDFSSPKAAPKRAIAKRKIWNVCWFNCWSAQSKDDLLTHLKNQPHINWNQLTKTFMLSTGRFDTPTPTGNCLPFVGSFYMLAKIRSHFLLATFYKSRELQGWEEIELLEETRHHADRHKKYDVLMVMMLIALTF